MTQTSLDIEIIGLASRGFPLTVQNVASNLGRSQDEAEAALDAMARKGLLDLDLDEDTGALTYVPRGLTAMGTPPTPPPAAQAPAPAPPPTRFMAPPPPAGPLAPEKRKHQIVGMLWALIVPGFGLYYAAPGSVALLAGVLCFSTVELFEAIPFIGGWLGPVVMVACALGSALLSLVYTKRYNEVGARAHLDDDLGDRILSRVR